jgi:hypothetical protein
MDQLIPGLAALVEAFRDGFHPQVFPGAPDHSLSAVAQRREAPERPPGTFPSSGSGPSALY